MSHEVATEYSPRRKAWDSKVGKNQAPEVRKNSFFTDSKMPRQWANRRASPVMDGTFLGNVYFRYNVGSGPFSNVVRSQIHPWRV